MNSRGDFSPYDVARTLVRTVLGRQRVAESSGHRYQAIPNASRRKSEPTMRALDSG